MAYFESAPSAFTPVVVSNRGPFDIAEDGGVRRGSGGLVTALSSLVERTGSPWIASARNDFERNLAKASAADLSDGHRRFRVHFVGSGRETYRKHCSVFANQVLWPLQHRLAPFGPKAELILDAWKSGYSVVNRLVASRTAEALRGLSGPPVVLVHDYHLYLAPRSIRRLVPGAVVQQFVHIPWPDRGAWEALPKPVLEDLLGGLLSNDLVGFQTAADVDNFLACCESEGFQVDERWRAVRLPGRVVEIRDYPISVDSAALGEMAGSAAVERELRDLLERRPEKVILRIDRVDPAKNALTGFEAFARLLGTHPEWKGRVEFWAFLQPSRQDVAAYRAYAESVVRKVDRVNSRFGYDGWKPIRLELWENLPRALAAYQLFDVLLVNSRYDGMNLVAKEGMLLNRRSGALVLSRTVGAHAELGPWAISIDAPDAEGTASALHHALSLPEPERARRGRAMRAVIKEHDLDRWIDLQLRDLTELVFAHRLESVG